MGAVPQSGLPAGIEHVETSGLFSIDGEDFEVDNNIWIVGDDDEVLIVDAAHDAAPILEVVRGRRVVAIVATHGHNDHINAAADLAEATGGPILFHPADAGFWAEVYGDRRPDGELTDGQVLHAGGHDLTVMHTPGHSPGGVCLHDAGCGVLFSADTLFHGGPGATGRRASSFETIIDSITGRLFPLPDDTLVLTGHGDCTTIGTERPDLQEWLDRGH